MGFRRWLYNLLYNPAAVRTVTMAEGKRIREKAEQRFWEEKKYDLDNKGMRKSDGTDSA